MSALVNTLDNSTPIQIGENGHAEYGWSNNVQERIAQFHMQMTRTDATTIQTLGDVFDSIIVDIQSQYNNGKISKEKMVDMLSIMYKMFGLTRDIIDGKGEYALSYMLIYRWYAFYPELAMFALKTCISLNEAAHPFGSWKDIKYFCNYCKTLSLNDDHPLIQYAIQLTNDQLKIDINSSTPSLLGKWIPREKSAKFGWLFKQLAVNYFNEYIITAKTQEQHNSARLKCFTKYRVICSELNKKLDTVQIKQCGNEWSSIVPSNLTSITMHKQKKAFLNKTKDNKQRSDKEDRIQCANNFIEFIQKVKTGEKVIKGKRVGLNDFTKNALEMITIDDHGYDGYEIYNTDEIDILNAQWRDNSTQTGALGDMIAMVDVSGSMEGDPIHAAIALGCRVAEKSKLGKRVLTFSATPSWVNLESCNEFTDMVLKLKNADWGTETNIYAAFHLILDAIEKSKLSHEEVEKMVFVIFSDMQINRSNEKYCSPEKLNTLFSQIENMYSERGIRMTGKPFKPPHLLFWNLRSTGGNPVLSTERNVSSMSGFSPALLNVYCEKGLEGLQCYTPWLMLLDLLSNQRYQVLGEKMIEVLL